MIVRATFSVRRFVANVLLIAGTICVGFCAYSYLSSAVYQFSAGRQFDEQRAQIASIERKPEPALSVKPHSHLRSETLPQGHVIGRLSIPRLNLNVLVAEGDDDATLQRAVGHIPGTALPGETGNTGIAGHRDTFLRSLKNLENHDQIVFTTLHGTYRYVVDQMEIVEPSNLSVLASTGGQTLTIVTCYPFHYIGPAPRRFIVRAHQVAETRRSAE